MSILNTMVTLKQFAKKYPFFNYTGWRSFAKSNPDFRKKCIRKVGTRVVVLEKEAIEFFEKECEWDPN